MTPIDVNSAGRQVLPLPFCLAFFASPAGAWDPQNADWEKSHAYDVRLMTWNVQDGICSTNSKQDGNNNWSALARIVAAMKPDVLLLQETADNNGNGTGSGADSAAVLEQVLGLFIYGGVDVFSEGAPDVGAYVTLFAASVDLPHVYGSTATDGYNRNALASRFGFADLNGDLKVVIPNIPTVLADEYAPGGHGGIRGFLFAELDLPDEVYLGDLVVGNAHLKAGFYGSDHAQRVTAGQNVAYYVDYLLNGAGTEVPDPNDRILDTPPAMKILDGFTPVVIGGDWNEDDVTNGVKGPAEWLTCAEFVDGLGGEPDGTDRDRSDMAYDGARHVFTGSRYTQSSRKLDYIGVQNSIATIRRSFVFDTNGTPIEAMPPEVLAFPSPLNARFLASDHRPVIVDLILPIVGDLDGNGDVDASDHAAVMDCLSGPAMPRPASPCDRADGDHDGDVDLRDLAMTFNLYNGS